MQSTHVRIARHFLNVTAWKTQVILLCQQHYIGDNGWVTVPLTFIKFVMSPGQKFVTLVWVTHFGICALFPPIFLVHWISKTWSKETSDIADAMLWSNSGYFKWGQNGGKLICITHINKEGWIHILEFLDLVSLKLCMISNGPVLITSVWQLLVIFIASSDLICKGPLSPSYCYCCYTFCLWSLWQPVEPLGGFWLTLHIDIV